MILYPFFLATITTHAPHAPHMRVVVQGTEMRLHVTDGQRTVVCDDKNLSYWQDYVDLISTVRAEAPARPNAEFGRAHTGRTLTTGMCNMSMTSSDGILSAHFVHADSCDGAVGCQYTFLVFQTSMIEIDTLSADIDAYIRSHQ